MSARRLLMAAGTSSDFTPPAAPPPPANNYVGLINAAATSAYQYKIGAVTSSDYGATWTAAAASSFGPGTGGSWDDTYVKDPTLIWDGTQFVCYFCGFDGGSTFRIGRATASSVTGTWTKYASNPVVDIGGVGDPDRTGLLFPFVLYESGTYRMWYTGQPAGASPGSPSGDTLCYAESSDGISWTKYGKVLDVTGTEVGLLMGPVINIASTWHVFYGAFDSGLKCHSYYATTTNPQSAAAYSRVGAISGFTGNTTVGGWTWQSNLPRSIWAVSGGYRIGMDFWNPTPVDTEEACTVLEASSLTSWSAPTGLMIPLDDGSWHSNSAENPAVIIAP